MQIRPPAVTVILPTYNSSGTLKLSLETVLAQDWTDYEVWVVGDGCEDDSENVVSSFHDPRLHWLNLAFNSGGPSKPRNQALLHAQGRLIAYLGHDDLWFPWHLRELVDYIERVGCDLVCSLGVIVGPQGARNAFTMPAKAWDSESTISPSNWLHRRELIDRIGSWSTRIKLGDDREFLSRAIAANARLGTWRQVSVLKFPSIMWKLYAGTGDFPQTKYGEAIRRDAAQLRLDLLTELAALPSSQMQPLSSNSLALPAPVRALVERSFDVYGRHRWPLNDFLYWRWRSGSGLPRRGARTWRM